MVTRSAEREKSATRELFCDNCPEPLMQSTGLWLLLTICGPGLAPQALQTACSGGDMQACNNLGAAYESGTGVARDLARAASLYDRACAFGEPSGCLNLAVSLVEGSGIEMDIPRGVKLLETTCQGGNSGACNNSVTIPRAI